MTEGNSQPQNVPGRRAAVLRLLVVADLAAGGEAGPLALTPEPGGIDAALAAVSPALSLVVPNRLGSAAKDLALSLRFRCLDDFHPEALAAQLPATSAAAAVPAAGTASPLDALLAQVEVPQTAQTPQTAQVAEILRAEPLRALEADWRGLDFLARRAAPHPVVRIEVLAAPKEAFLDAFFEQVFPAEHDGTAEVPLSAVVLGYEFDRSPGDVEMLRHAGRMGESLRVPFLAAVGAPFWGLRQARLLAGLPDLVRKLQGPEYAKWNGLRLEDASLWLCLAANRFRLRSAGDDGGAGQPLWGSGAYALAAVLVQGFAAGGVSFPLAGEAARLADLSETPVEVPLPDAKILELSRLGLALLTAARGETAAHFPSLPTLHAPKRYVQDEATRNAVMVATLPYQAFAGAAAHVLQEIAHETGGGLAPEDVKRRFEEGLRAFLAGAGTEPAPEPETATEPATPAIEVEVQPHAEDPGIWEVIVRLRPKFRISGGEVDLVLGSAVPR
ncbi:MAG TPA: type VI secretion system contractile sheath large subunit [Thermoanaerobaculia bacterium]|nr:type VI secretion system contractile sheath large subunit [Thermoanaerobaculia bacterium]